MARTHQGWRNRGEEQGGARPPDFGRAVNPISTRGTDYAHQITTRPPRPDFDTFRHPCAMMHPDPSSVAKVAMHEY